MQNKIQFTELRHTKSFFELWAFVILRPIRYARCCSGYKDFRHHRKKYCCLRNTNLNAWKMYTKNFMADIMMKYKCLLSYSLQAASATV